MGELNQLISISVLSVYCVISFRKIMPKCTLNLHVSITDQISKKNIYDDIINTIIVKIRIKYIKGDKGDKFLLI